jgi:hypothetical protein
MAPLGLVVPSVAEVVLLEILVTMAYEGSHYYLFDGSVTPTLGDTSTTYLTHQVTWPGISNPTASGWGSVSIGSDSHAVVAGPSLNWTFSAAAGNQTVGGAFSLNAAGELLGAELILNGPVVLTATGQVLPYTPQVRLSSIYGSDTV